MAARPRSEHVYHVRAEGPSWIGFWYVYDESGRRLQKRRKVCDRDGVTLTEARERHAKWVREHVLAYGAEPDHPTLQVLWERHISAISAKVEKGKRALHWERTLHSLWGQLEDLHDREAATITSDDVEEVFDDLESLDYSASTLRKTRALLAQLLRGHSAAVGEAQLRFRSGPKGRVLSLAQVRAVRERLGPVDRTIFGVYVFLGLSAREGWRLQLRHVESDRLWVPGTKTEHRAAELPLPADLAAELNALAEKHRDCGRPETHRLLFAEASHRVWLEQILQPAAAAAGVPNLTMLDLRRTAGTFVSRYADVGTASRLLRHSTTAVTQKHYIGGEDATLRTALESVMASVKDTGSVM